MYEPKQPLAVDLTMRGLLILQQNKRRIEDDKH